MTEIRVLMSVTDKKNMYIALSEEDFLKYKPPCDECLINNMCISDYRRGYGPMQNYILIKYCHLLKKFISDNEHFTFII